MNIDMDGTARFHDKINEEERSKTKWGTFDHISYEQTELKWEVTGKRFQSSVEARSATRVIFKSNRLIPLRVPSGWFSEITLKLKKPQMR